MASAISRKDHPVNSGIIEELPKIAEEAMAEATQPNFNGTVIIEFNFRDGIGLDVVVTKKRRRSWMEKK